MCPDLRLSLLLVLLICSAVSWTATASAVAEPLATADATLAEAAPTNSGSPTAAMDSAVTKELIDTLKDPGRRAVLIATLENLRKSMPNGTQAAAVPGSTTRSAAIKPVGALKPDSLGTQLFANGVRFSETISASLFLTARGVAVIPDFLSWLRGVTLDPALLLNGARSAGRLLYVVLIPLGGELLVRRVMHRFNRSQWMRIAKRRKLRPTRSPLIPLPSPQRMRAIKCVWETDGRCRGGCRSS
jgi:hypothetical protein